MLKLVGGTHFLSLTRAADGLSHIVDMRPRFDEVLARWTSGTRMSPVSPINNAPIPSFGDGSERWLLFGGPVFPGDINPDQLGALFVTLGLFNLLIVSESNEAATRARERLDHLSAPWEEWTLVGHTLKSIRNSQARSATALPPALRSTITGQSPALTPTLREYATLVATTTTRAHTYLPKLAEDVLRFDTFFRDLLGAGAINEVAKQGLVVTANAVLSRHSSQTYAGISPILETECQFSTHSLLGIGIASLALTRIRSFVERVVGEARLLPRLRLLERLPAEENEKDLLALGALSEYWDVEHLFDSRIDAAAAQVGPEVLPLLTCYSGRDGFRSTKLSLSAPLEVITSCNTTVWTPLTLTHEITHTLIDGALGILLPAPESPERLESTLKLLEPRPEIANKLDALRRYTNYSLWKLDTKSSTANMTVGDLADLVKRQWVHLNETLTHVLDFLYFYQRDPTLYIDSLWASWGVIPNIQSRVPAYIVRSLCALHANNLRQKESLDLTLTQLRDQLERTKKEFPNDLIDQAIESLTKSRSDFKNELRLRVPFVKIARTFLHQERVTKGLFSERLVAGGDHEGYPLTVSEFDEKRISNPLRFITGYAREKQPHSTRSTWLLTHLAFGAP